MPTQEWTRTCGMCKRQNPHDAEFSFSEEDLLVNKIGVPYVKCCKGHCNNLSKNDPDDLLREAISRKLSAPDTVKMLENAKAERAKAKVVKMEKKKEKEIKAKLSEIEKGKEGKEKAEDGAEEEEEKTRPEKQLDHYQYIEEDEEEKDDEDDEEEYEDKDDELNVEDMLNNAGISNKDDQIDQHQFIVEDAPTEEFTEERSLPTEEFTEERSLPTEEFTEESFEKWGDFPERFLGKTWELLCPVCHEYFAFFIGDIKFKKNNVPFVSCPNEEGHPRGGLFPVTISKDAMANDELLKEAIKFMRGLPENVKKIEDAKGNTKVAKGKVVKAAKTDEDGIAQEKPRRIEAKGKSKDNAKGHVEIPRETDNVILKHGYMYEKGEEPVSTEMREREKVKMWGHTALDDLKREKLEDELNAVTGQEEVINRILKRFNNDERVRNNQLALFDTIKEFITRLQSAYVTDIVNSVFSVDKRYRPLIDSSHEYDSHGYNNMNMNMGMGAGMHPQGDYNYRRPYGDGNNGWHGNEYADQYSHESISKGDVSNIVKDAISEIEREKEKEKYITHEDVATIIKNALKEADDAKRQDKYVTPEAVADIVKSAFTDRMTMEDDKRREEERTREMWGIKNEINAVRSEMHTGGNAPGKEEGFSYLGFLKTRLEKLEDLRDTDMKSALSSMQEKTVRSENFDLEMKKLDHATELKKMELGEEEKKRDTLQGMIAPVAAEVGAALGGVIPNMIMPPAPAPVPQTEIPPASFNVSSSPSPAISDDNGREEPNHNDMAKAEAKTENPPGKNDMEQAFCPSCGNLIGFPKGASAFKCPVCGTTNEIRKCKECGAPIIYMRGATNVQCSGCGKVYSIKKVGKGKR